MNYVAHEVRVYNEHAEWYLNDQLHRVGGPAIEYNHGTKLWYFNGLRHREDGPAVEGSNGTREWYLEGKEYTEAEYYTKLNPDPCEGKTVTIDGTTYTLNRTQK